jgi:hypothetical protein
MKITGYYRFSGALILLALAAGCALSPRAGGKGGTPASPFLEEARELPLFPEEGPGGPRLRISLSLFDPRSAPGRVSGELLRDSLYNGYEPGDYAEGLIMAKSRDYLALREAEYPGESLNWEYSERIEPLPSPERGSPGASLLLFARIREYYEGGAHGMREARFFVIDPERGRLLRLEDLAGGENPGALRELAGAALRRSSGLGPGAPLTEAGFFEEELGELPANFFPSPEGLVLHWDPYEIAPYALGPVRLLIPWGELGDLLSPAYR